MSRHTSVHLSLLPLRRSSLVLLTTALLSGAAVAVLPLPVIAPGLAGLVLAAFALVEPMSGMVSLLLVAPLKTLVETESTYALPLDVGQITLLLMVTLWGLNRVARRQPLALRGSPVQVPFFVFAIAAALSVPGALSIGAGLAELLKWVEILFLISFCLAIYQRREAHWLVFAIVLAGAAQAVIGVYEFLGGSGAAHLWILDNRFFRAFGSFGQPNPFGAFMGLTLALALGAALGYGLEARRIVQSAALPWRVVFRHEAGRLALLSGLFYLGMAGLIGIGLAVSWSRGAWMSFAVAALAMVFLVPRTAVKGATLTVAVVVLVLAVWSSGLVPDPVVARLGGFVEELTTLEDVRGVDITDSNYAVAERIAHWQAAVLMAQDHPWLGVGFGNYEIAYPAYALLNWPYPLGHAHNYYLNLLAEVGWVGLVAYIIAWGTIFVLTFRVWRRSEGLARGWSIGLTGAWTYLTAHNLLDKLYVNNLFLHIGCMLGLLAILMTEERSG